MREIKFRAWDKRYGLVKIHHLDFSEKSGNIRTIHGSFDNGQSSLSTDDKKETILMQYTGLKDKNNIEIYEGDIVKNVFDELKVVYFIDGVFVMTDFEKQNTWRCDSDLVAINHCEVVGDIYQNKELLK